MTTERWTDERLDKFASTVETNLIDLHRATTGRERAMEALAHTQVQILQRVEKMQENIETMQGEIKEIQSEVKGLQTENRRILDRMFGEQSS
jgi:peptidoglycan hydrolase CwlO-like protein